MQRKATGDAAPPMSRRELLRQWAPAALTGAALAAAGGWLSGRPGRHAAMATEQLLRPPDWRADPDATTRLAVAGRAGPVANLRQALAEMGGMAAFVHAGERVLVKPNCAWDRRPEQAANTDPELVAELVRQCLGAGAAAVVVADNTCNDPERVMARSGIGEAARAAGARVLHQHTAGTVTYDLGGSLLGAWEVLAPLAEVDRVINVPVVKHHSLVRATLGMKNWMGVLVGKRARLHQDMATVCAELGAALRPTLTVVDATRVLMSGGPTGGSLDLVRHQDLVAVATDPVAADAWGASLLGLQPGELPHLLIAERLGLGTSRWPSLLVGA